MKKTDKDLELLFESFREVPGRAAQAAVNGRTAFLEQARVLRMHSIQQASGPLRAKTHSSTAPLLGRRWSPVLITLLALVFSLAVLFGAGAATVYAAQGSLPNETLYPLKTLSEDAFLSLTLSPQARLDLTLDYTDRRLNEIAGLQSAGQPIPQMVVDRYQGELDQVLVLAAGMDNKSLPLSLEQVSDHAAGQLQKVTILVKTDSALQNVYARLQEQVQLVELGKSNPDGFRLDVTQQVKGDNRTQNSDRSTLKGTPVPPGMDKNPGGDNSGQPSGRRPDHTRDHEPTRMPRGHRP